MSNRTLKQLLAALIAFTAFVAAADRVMSAPIATRAPHIDQIDNEGDDVAIGTTTVTIKRLKYVYGYSIPAVDDRGLPFWPKTVAVDDDGNIYTTGSRLGVEEYDKTGQHVTSIGLDTGQAGGMAQQQNGQLVMPFGVAVSGGSVYVTDGNWLQIFHTAGDYVGGVDLHDDSVQGPTVLTGVGVGPDGSIYVIDSQKPAVLTLSSGGQESNSWGTKGKDDGDFTTPRCVVANADGDIIVDDENANNIQVFGSDGTFKFKIGGKQTGDDKLTNPQGLALDSLEDIFVCTQNNVRAYSKTGDYLGDLPPSRGKAPIIGEAMGIAIDKSNNLYIANSNNKSIDVYLRQK